MSAHNRRRIWIVLSVAVALVVASALLLAPGVLAQGTVTPEASPAPGSTPAAQDEPGLVIVSVAKDGPAAQAGVKRGDILLEVDGTAVNTVADLKASLNNRQAGAKITLVVMHGDDRRTLTATVAEGNRYPVLGLTPVGSPAANAVRKLGALPLFGNVVVQQVTPEQPGSSGRSTEGGRDRVCGRAGARREPRSGSPDHRPQAQRSGKVGDPARR